MTVPRHVPARPPWSAPIVAALLLAAVLPATWSSGAPVSFSLFTTTGGWGLTAASVASPGPTLTVAEGDLVQLSLTGADNAWHNFFVDYNGNGQEDAGQGEPVSPDFRTTTVSYSFTADVPGTFKYICGYHSKLAFGTIVITPAPPANTRPTVSIASPAGASSWTGGSTHAIAWNMTDTMDPPSSLVAYINYSSSAGGGAVAGPLSGGSNPQSFLWTVPFLNATDVRVNVSVLDSEGLHGSAEVAVATVDGRQPTVVATVPADGATGVDPLGSLYVNFSEAMNRAAAEAAVSLTEHASGAAVPLSVQGWTGNSMLLAPAVPLRNDTLYDAAVGPAALDASDPGNAAHPFSWSFRTHNNAPRAAITAPDAQSRWTGGSSQSVRWTASDGEDPAANLSVELSYSPTGTAPWAAIAGPLAGDGSPATWSVPTDDTATARLQLVVTDGSGLSTTVLSAPFAVDSTPPSVVDTFPANGSSGAVRNTRIFITWSEPMDEQATGAPTAVALLDVNASQWVAGAFGWNSGGDGLVFAPSAPLASNTLYEVYVNASATDGSKPGNPAAGQRVFTFTTSDLFDSQAPAIASVVVSPAEQSPGVPVTVTVIASDDTRVAEAWANVTGPSGEAVGNFSLRSTDGSNWTVSVLSPHLGSHRIAVWVCDEAANCAAGNASFSAADITPPSVGSLQADPSVVAAPGTAVLSAAVADNSAVAAVWVVVAGQNLTALEDAGSGRYSAAFAVESVGTFSYTFWARDAAGLVASATGTFEAEDLVPPAIAGAAVSPPTQELGQAATIAVNASDWQGLARVWVEVVGGANITLAAAPTNGTFVGSVAATEVGIHAFTVWAEDPSGNRASLTGSFETKDTVAPSIDHTPVPRWPRGVELPLNATADDLGGVAAVWVKVTGTNGRTANITAERVDATHFSALVSPQNRSGTLNYTVVAADASGNVAETAPFSVEIPADVVEAKQEDPTLLTGVIITLAAVGAPEGALALVLFARRKKARAKPLLPEAAGEPAPAAAAAPAEKWLTPAMQVLLCAAAAAGVLLLFADAHLWETAPDHAYALVAFNILNAVLAGALGTRWSLAPRAATLWAAAQCAIMLGDIVTAPQYNLTHTQFAAYLFGQPAFVAIQAAQAAVFILGMHKLGGLWPTLRGKARQPREA